MAKVRRNARWQEAGWLIGRDVADLCHRLRDCLANGLISGRKCGLYMVTCARRVAALCPDDEAYRRAVELCERCLDDPDLWSSEELNAHEARLRNRTTRTPLSFETDQLLNYLLSNRHGLHSFYGDLYESGVWSAANRPKPEQLQIATLRDIFGNPFRQSSFSPSWRTDTVLALARTMYAARDFSAMPILADALQDAGCDNGDILNHCCDPQPVHVRGCWVVDSVLGKQ